MHTDQLKLGGAGLGIAIVFFIAGHVARFCFLGVCPDDGNPIGFHLHGLAKVDKTSISLNGCNTNTCNLDFNFVIARRGQPQPTATSCPSPNCFHFWSSGTMSETSKDDNGEKPTDDNVSADGTVTGP
jgi:hypothetical protein